MIKFEYQFDDTAPKVVLELSPESSLPEVIDQFELFLLASGYSFEGHLDFYEDVVLSPGSRISQ